MVNRGEMMDWLVVKECALKSISVHMARRFYLITLYCLLFLARQTSSSFDILFLYRNPSVSPVKFLVKKKTTWQNKNYDLYYAV